MSSKHENRFETVINNIIDGYYECGRNGIITYCNDSFVRLLGKDREAVLGTNHSEIFPSEEIPVIDELFSRVSDSGIPEKHASVQVNGPKGETKHMDISILPVSDGKKKSPGFRCIIRDVSHRNHFIDALIESERKLHDLVEHLPEIVFELDSSGKINYINKRSTEVLGFTREELMGTSALELVIPEQRERAARGLGKTLKGKRYTGESYYFQSKTRGIPIHLYTSPIEESGVIIGIRGIAIDISNIVEAQNAVKESEEKFRTMIEHSSEIISILDPEGTIQYESQSLSQLLGYDPAKRMGTSALDMVHPDDREKLVNLLKHSTSSHNDRPGVVEYRYRHIDGSWRHMESTGNNLSGNSLVRGILLNTRDITERKLAEKSMTKREEKYRRLYNNALVGMVTVDYPTWTIIETNDLGYGVLGYDSPAEFIGNDFLGLFADSSVVNNIIRKIESSGEVTSVEVSVINRNGEKIWVEISAKRNDDTETLNVVIIDVSKRKKAEELLTYYTFYDQLTQLPNREMFSNKMQMEIVKAHRRDRDEIFAVMCLGLDRFKNINEMHGPVMGDRLLQKIAVRLKAGFRDDDLVSRLDGDKFMILFSEIGSPEGVVDIVRKTFGIFVDPFILDDNVFHITISIGVSIFPNDGKREDTLIRNAETAMYHAKEMGRNTYYLYDEEMNKEILRRIRIEEELRYAIIRNEFFAHYQPKVTRDGRIVGMESLIRWHSPARGIVPPFEFIPLAEKNGMIEEIGNIILYKSCVQNIKLQEKGYCPVPVAVNFSPVQFKHPDLVPNIRRVLKETNLLPQWLELEITESGIMFNEDDSIEKLKELNRMGLSISIDDFGTGYSSLSKLKDYPIDMLKIDKSFIDHLPHNAKSATIATTIIDLAHNLGFRVVAEGVEKIEQLDFLVDNNCDYFQGYYFDKPLSIEDFEERMKCQ